MGDKPISTTTTECERDAALTCLVKNAQSSQSCNSNTEISDNKQKSDNITCKSSPVEKKLQSTKTEKENESATKQHKEAPALWKSHHQKQQEELQQHQQNSESSAAGNAASRESASTDWQESRLPALFGCFNTAVPPPAEPMLFHSKWDLHADDHSIANTSRFSLPVHAGGSAITPQNAISFDPVYIATVHDVESFWRLWWCVTPPSKCPIPFTYSWFRHDIKPEWEHPRNRQGGKFTIVIFDRDRPGLNDKVALDDVFTAMVLGAVGESFAECHTTLNGVMLKLRQNKPVTLQIWTSHSEMVKLRSFAHSVRDVLSKIIGSKPLQKLEYFSHLQNLASYSSTGPASRMKSKAKIASDYTF